jgi:hypothetical protein
MLTLLGIIAAAIAVAVIVNWTLHFFKWDLIDEIKNKQDLKRQTAGAKIALNEEVVADLTEQKIESIDEVVNGVEAAVTAAKVEVAVVKTAVKKPRTRRTTAKKSTI